VVFGLCSTIGLRFPDARRTNGTSRTYVVCLDCGRSSRTTGPTCGSASPSPCMCVPASAAELPLERNAAEHYRVAWLQGPKAGSDGLFAHRLIRQYGERNGLFGVGVNAMLGGSGNGDAGQETGQNAPAADRMVRLERNAFRIQSACGGWLRTVPALQFPKRIRDPGSGAPLTPPPAPSRRRFGARPLHGPAVGLLSVEHRLRVRPRRGSCRW